MRKILPGQFIFFKGNQPGFLFFLEIKLLFEIRKLDCSHEGLMISFYSKNDQKSALLPTSQVKKGAWIHAEIAKSEDLQEICLLTGLQMSDLHDTLDRYELPRVEKLHKGLLLFARHPIQQDRHLYTTPLTMILTKHYFITISPIKNPLIQHILQKKDVSFFQSDTQFLLTVLLRITQEFNVCIRKIRHHVMTQEKEMNAVTSEDISALTQYEEILNQYLPSLGLLYSSLKQLISSSDFSEEAHAQIDDVLNSVKQSENLCESLIKNIRSLRDSYQIIFANNLTKTIKLLTSLTIIFTIPNIIASIYGMNVPLPFAHEGGAFSWLLLGMFFLSALCGYWFYRKNWL